MAIHLYSLIYLVCGLFSQWQSRSSSFWVALQRGAFLPSAAAIKTNHLAVYLLLLLGEKNIPSEKDIKSVLDDLLSTTQLDVESVEIGADDERPIQHQIQQGPRCQDHRRRCHQLQHQAILPKRHPTDSITDPATHTTPNSTRSALSGPQEAISDISAFRPREHAQVSRSEKTVQRACGGFPASSPSSRAKA